MSSEGVIECARDNFASSRTQNIDAIAYVTDFYSKENKTNIKM